MNLKKCLVSVVVMLSTLFCFAGNNLSEDQVTLLNALESCSVQKFKLTSADGMSCVISSSYWLGFSQRGQTNTFNQLDKEVNDRIRRLPDVYDDDMVVLRRMLIHEIDSLILAQVDFPRLIGDIQVISSEIEINQEKWENLLEELKQLDSTNVKKENINLDTMDIITSDYLVKSNL